MIFFVEVLTLFIGQPMNEEKTKEQQRIDKKKLYENKEPYDRKIKKLRAQQK